MTSSHIFLICTLLFNIRGENFKEAEPGQCNLQKDTCNQESCRLFVSAYSMSKIKPAVEWFHNDQSINRMIGRSARTRYTTSKVASFWRCVNQIICYRTNLSLTIMPFEARDFGVYECSLMTENNTNIRCSSVINLKLSNGIQDGTEGHGITNISNQQIIYIAVGSVIGCLVIVVVILVVALRRSSSRRNRGENSNITSDDNQNETAPKRKDKSRRKTSNGHSNHTYASINSDIVKYEALRGRRETNAGYTNPTEALNIEGSTGYLNPEEHCRLRVPSVNEDEESDVSFDVDSVFSISTFSQENDNQTTPTRKSRIPSDMNDPTYSARRPSQETKGQQKEKRTNKTVLRNPNYGEGSFSGQNKVIVVNKTIHKIETIEVINGNEDSSVKDKGNNNITELGGPISMSKRKDKTWKIMEDIPE